MRIAFVSTYPPRRCGIATFTSDLIRAVRDAEPKVQSRVAAIEERGVVHPYGGEVRWRIRQGHPESYVAAAEAIERSNADVVCVQHEFGLYGVWNGGGMVGDTWIEGQYEDHLVGMLHALHKPTLVTLHTVLPDPSPSIRDTMAEIADAAHGLVVMAESAVDILMSDTYGLTNKPIVIHHGMPHIEPAGRRRLKVKLGLEDRQIVSTFGLVGPGKGLEYMIEAMPKIVAEHPDALYLIAGQTHPELLRQQGEEYRNKLLELVESLDMGNHVAFVNSYLEQKDIIEFLLASDVYVTPYLDPNQITSGTLSYALGAGKAVVSTPYLHAVEALADKRGVLVEFRSSEALADGVNSVLGDPKLKRGFERRAYAYANQATWPKTGAKFVRTMEELESSAKPTAPPRAPKRQQAVPIVERLAQNPLITPDRLQPTQPGLEVISTINPGVAKVGDETVLLVRVAEHPDPESPVPDGASMIDLSGPGPRLVPMPPSLPRDRLVGLAVVDRDRDPPQVVIGYVSRDLPGIDLSDPRTLRLRNVVGGFTPAAEEFRDYLTHISHLRVARSADGVEFVVEPHAAVSPTEPLEEYGVEDPRITLIDGTYQITYVSVSRLGIATSRLSTTDFTTFERHGVMLGPDHKDVVLFPERVGGRYVALTRPMPGSFGRVLGIWLAESDDLNNWGDHRPVALPRLGMWDEMRIGASLVPIRVDAGWLAVYHGADRTNRYAVGALLLDADDPAKVLGRSTRPIMVPSKPYERAGFLGDVVFPSGHTDLGDGRIRIFYGAADSVLCAADVGIDDVLASVDPC